MGSDNEYEHQSSAKPVSKWSNHMDNRRPNRSNGYFDVDGNFHNYTDGYVMPPPHPGSIMIPNPLFCEQVTNKNNT